MTAAIPLRYHPAGPVSEAYVASRAFVRAIMGPIGSGKSTASVFAIFGSILTQQPSPRDGVRRLRWAIIRNTYPELRSTTMATWHFWVPMTVGKWRDAGPPLHKLQLQIGQSRAELEVLFLALDRPDDVAKLLSLELSGAWINEAREVPREVLQHLQGRVLRYPPKIDGGPTHPTILLDTNPPDTDHWWYALFEEACPPEFEVFRQPSGLSAQAENRKNLDDAYYETAAIGQTKEWIKVYVHGQYGYAQDGLPVYGDDYRDDLHCAAVDLTPVRGLPLVLGVDGGLTPALVIGQVLPTGQKRLLDELAVEQHGKVGPTRFGQMTAQRLAERYAGFDIRVCWADPATQYGGDNAGGDQSWFEAFEASSALPVKPAPTNGLAPRLDAVREPLRTFADGQPSLLLSRRCRLLRKGFMAGYRYRRQQVSGAARFEDVPEKNLYSHVHDAAQYLLLGAGGYLEITGRRQARSARRARLVAGVGGGVPRGW